MPKLMSTDREKVRKTFLTAGALDVETWVRKRLEELWDMILDGKVGDEELDMGTTACPVECSTVGCVGGWVYMLEHGTSQWREADRFVKEADYTLRELFFPNGVRAWNTLTQPKIATAISRFLSGDQDPWGHVDRRGDLVEG